MTEPTDAELDELRQANSGRLNFVTFSEFRTIARAVLAKWGTPPAQRRRARAMADALEPVVTLVWDKSDDGTYRAVMTVSGLQTEQQAQAAVAHMQRLFCGQEQEPKNG